MSDDVKTDENGLQIDDGSRNALDMFIKELPVKQREFAQFCVAHGEFWKGRVFLELLWEYQSKRLRIVKDEQL